MGHRLRSLDKDSELHKKFWTIRKKLKKTVDTLKGCIWAEILCTWIWKWLHKTATIMTKSCAWKNRQKMKLMKPEIFIFNVKFL